MASRRSKRRQRRQAAPRPELAREEAAEPKLLSAPRDAEGLGAVQRLLAMQATHGNDFVQRAMHVQRQEQAASTESASESEATGANPAAEMFESLWGSSVVTPLLKANVALPADPQAAYDHVNSAIGTVSDLNPTAKTNLTPESYQRMGVFYMGLRETIRRLQPFAGITEDIQDVNTAVGGRAEDAANLPNEIEYKQPGDVDIYEP